MAWASYQFLRTALATPFDGPTVVVTHHAPDRGSIAPVYAGEMYTPRLLRIALPEIACPPARASLPIPAATVRPMTTRPSSLLSSSRFKFAGRFTPLIDHFTGDSDGNVWIAFDPGGAGVRGDACQDYAWTKYITASAAKLPHAAAFWSMAIILLGAFSVVSYTQNHWMLIPAALGAYAGTFLSVWREKRKR